MEGKARGGTRPGAGRPKGSRTRRVLAVPDRIAAQVAAETDIGACRLLLDDAIREALSSVTETPPELSR